jgi:hypothetical protein
VQCAPLQCLQETGQGTSLSSPPFMNISHLVIFEVPGGFGETYRLHLQGRRINRAKNQLESRCKEELWFLAWLIFRP